ncbi:hypothetical protein FRB94_005235 [Tulasnella sp. JGI-2019a]|nr:hypothetical protein FRB94_005235 [Tulasnella sp. JGI-2019a]KAG9029736.1 hypothetical protein FRB95_004938 [Tulasnella sp. JGI-2019a]
MALANVLRALSTRIIGSTASFDVSAPSQSAYKKYRNFDLAKPPESYDKDHKCFARGTMNIKLRRSAAELSLSICPEDKWKPPVVDL